MINSRNVESVISFITAYLIWEVGGVSRRRRIKNSIKIPYTKGFMHNPGVKLLFFLFKP